MSQSIRISGTEARERWDLWNEILNMMRKRAGKPLRPKTDNPYRNNAKYRLKQIAKKYRT